MSYLVLFVAGIVAYIVSTISSGGGALMMLPIVGFYLSPQLVAPVVNLGNMIGRPVRLILFWKQISWKVVVHFVPFAVLGAVVGGYIFTSVKAEWLQLLLGIFLISTLVQYRFGKQKHSFRMKLKYFMPLGFVVTVISTLVGATGAVLNVFYLNYGLIKEELIATKTANSFIAGIFQIGTYAFLGKLGNGVWIYGLAIGLGAAIGNYLGKHYLRKISDEVFRKIIIGLMAISGVVMLVDYFS